MKRTAKAQWKGTTMEGQGSITTPSGVFNEQPYSFKMRFQNEEGKLGTNPEELVAASHAACFNMALSLILGQAGFTADAINTQATLTMEQENGGFTVKSMVLDLTGSVPNITAEKFKELAEVAKANCPISKMMMGNVEITLNASLA
jgi:lipoyl-dependent peroxiredoxin